MDKPLFLYLCFITLLTSAVLIIDGPEALKGFNHTMCPSEGPPCFINYCAPNSPVCNQTIISPGTELGKRPSPLIKHYELLVLIASLTLAGPKIKAWIVTERQKQGRS